MICSSGWPAGGGEVSSTGFGLTINLGSTVGIPHSADVVFTRSSAQFVPPSGILVFCVDVLVCMCDVSKDYAMGLTHCTVVQLLFFKIFNHTDASFQ